MATDRLRRIGYGLVLAQGLVTTLAPKRSIDLKLRLWGLGVENVGDLEPKAWYVRSVRAAGIGMLAAGTAGLLMERKAASETGTAETEDEAVEEPVEVDV